MTEGQGMTDAGDILSNTEPTYRRHGAADVYSRIDYVFSTMQAVQYQLGWGHMDHAYMQAGIDMPQMKAQYRPWVKDWIVGSREFTRLGREVIVKTMLDHDQHDTYVAEAEMDQMIRQGIPEGFERRVQVACPEEGITELHVLNVIVSKLQSLAVRLGRDATNRDRKATDRADKQLKYLHRKLQQEQDEDDLQTSLQCLGCVVVSLVANNPINV
jgi:hypothetical protein